VTDPCTIGQLVAALQLPVEKLGVLLVNGRHVELDHLFAVSSPAIEQTILEQGLFPKRYEAQRRMFQSDGQLRLFQARVVAVASLQAALVVRVILRDIFSIGRWFSLDLKNMDVEYVDSEV